MTRNHMSKHTVEGAAATMRKEHGLGVDYMTRGFEKHLETKKPIDVWKEAVEDNFDQLGGGYQESDGGRGNLTKRLRDTIRHETVLNVAPLQTRLMNHLDSIMDTPKKSKDGVAMF
ncbi:hypothetical protein BGX31_005883 [Mortierella sp. GBA43]|nr:hypothetical protein BGX31_005883 [Mortierella sp. GBA43]